MHDDSPATAACPTWCHLPAGHAYKEEIAGRWVRLHTLPIGFWTRHDRPEVTVKISAVGYATAADAPTERVEQPLAEVVVERGAGSDLSAEDARELGRVLARTLHHAADTLDTL